MARKKLRTEDKPGFGMYRGSLRYRFTYNGVRRAVYGKTEEECRQKERELIRKLDQGIYKPGKDLTIAEWFERWTDNRRDSVKETTIRTQRVMFNAMKDVVTDAGGKRFGDMKLPEVDQQTVIDMRTSLRKKLHTRTVNDSIAMLNSMYKAAMIAGYVAKNPCMGIKALKRTEPPARDTVHRALTKEETAAFLAAALDSWYKNLYVFLLHTGCRIGEAGAILPGDIGPDGVTICRTITRTENGGYMIGSETKTAAGRRFIPLDPEARAALEDQQEITRALRGVDPEEDRPVFTAMYGSLVKSSTVNQDIANICRTAGVDRFSVHAFRDTFATRAIESGMEIKVLQEILGHTDIAMTLGLYTHAMHDSKIEQIRAVKF